MIHTRDSIKVATDKRATALDMAPSRRLTYSGMVRACVVLVGAALVAGCNQSSDHPNIHSPVHPTATAQVTVAVLGQGTLGGVPWRVDLLRESGTLCTLATVAGKQTGHGCDPPVSDALPINFIVDGLNPTVLLVYGAAAPQVAHLVSRSTDSSQEQNVILIKPSAPGDDRCFFAYATIPGTAIDLVALDVTGDQLFSGADKIRQSQGTTTPNSGR